MLGDDLTLFLCTIKVGVVADIAVGDNRDEINMDRPFVQSSG